MDLFVREISLPEPAPRDEYFGRLGVVTGLEREPLVFRAPVTFITGENGVGKSTLAEAIAVAMGFNAEGGTRNIRFTTRDTHSSLGSLIRVTKGARRLRDGFFLRAESFYNFATGIEEVGALRSYGGVSLHGQSHGESFISLVMNRFGGNGLYILDEPEAALSPMRQMTLICLMDGLVKAGSQFIVSTHSPILMSFPGAEVLQIEDGRIRSVPYCETEHFIMTKRFLNDPEGMLRRLLGEDETGE